MSRVPARGADRRQWIRDIIRCPNCGARLAELSCAACAVEYTTIDALPLMIAGADAAQHDLRSDGRWLGGHDVVELGPAPVRAAVERGDLILELGAGRETTTAPNIIRTDAFVFADEHLDVVADAHALPFADGTFDFVVSIAMLEHVHSPWVVADEIARVLRPGGQVLIVCAFLQPLHGYPDHYFNATESGLRHLFSRNFDTECCRPNHPPDLRQASVPLQRIREMAEAWARTPQVDLRSRWRRRRLEHALRTASHQMQQLGARMIEDAPDAAEAWRTIAPAVELLATRHPMQTKSTGNP